jgi:alpha-L-fucosidase
MRFTTKGNDFFAIVLNWDDAGVLIKSLDKNAIADAKIQNVQLLGSNEKIEWQSTDEGFKLSFPQTKPCEFAYSFKITFDKKVGGHLESEAVDEVMKHGSGN